MFFCLFTISSIAQVSVPLGGNTFANKTESKNITNSGIQNWSDPSTSFKVYVRLAKKGNLVISLNQLKKVVGKSELSISVNRSQKRIEVNVGEESVLAGEWLIKDTGYVIIEVKGLKKTGELFPEIGSLNLSGTSVDKNASFVKDNEGNFFYWGRRGPSVHLNYETPESKEIEWFYSEVTIPRGNDLQGSFFMANGFAEGYFGMQVNSPIERRILFSVWSPYQTDNPKEIPDSHKVKLLKKGKDVAAGEFGNEGAGGQSYLKFNWIAGQTYSFLVQAIPSADNSTTYTSYFFAPERGKWALIASFKRPQKQTYLKRIHSFVENFLPEYGNQSRKAFFKNQWVCDNKGEWTAVSTARFTTDNTGNKGYRMDFGGGVNGEAFFLRNGGFFSDFTQPKTTLKRKVEKVKPIINFNYLP